MTLFAVSGLVGIGAILVAEVETERIGPKSGVDDGNVFFGNGFWVVFVFFVEAFF